MPLKTRFSRLFSKSDSASSASSSSSHTDDAKTVPWTDRKPVSHTPKAASNSSANSSRLSSLASSRLSRIASWRSSTATTSSSGSNSTATSHSSVSSRVRTPGPRALNLHPSERPLTEQNLRHQEVLGRFTMKVAHRRKERQQLGNGEVSPRDSRSMSADMAAAMRGRTFETAFREWAIDEHGEELEEPPTPKRDMPLHQRRITEESISV